MSDFTSDHASKDLDLDETCASVEIYLYSVEAAYSTWRQKMNEAEVKPNAQQWLVLDLVHRRCLYEQAEESNHQINESSSGDEHWEPLFRIIHGLPGSGESKVLL